MVKLTKPIFFNSSLMPKSKNILSTHPVYQRRSWMLYFIQFKAWIFFLIQQTRSREKRISRDHLALNKKEVDGCVEKKNALFEYVYRIEIA